MGVSVGGCEWVAECSFCFYLWMCLCVSLLEIYIIYVDVSDHNCYAFILHATMIDVYVPCNIL